MIEMRWVWHDMENGVPPTGAVNMGVGAYQILQYRYRRPMPTDEIKAFPPRDWGWSEWMNVPHSGIIL